MKGCTLSALQRYQLWLSMLLSVTAETCTSYGYGSLISVRIVFCQKKTQYIVQQILVIHPRESEWFIELPNFGWRWAWIKFELWMGLSSNMKPGWMYGGAGDSLGWLATMRRKKLIITIFSWALTNPLAVWVALGCWLLERQYQYHPRA